MVVYSELHFAVFVQTLEVENVTFDSCFHCLAPNLHVILVELKDQSIMRPEFQACHTFH